MTDEKALEVNDSVQTCPVMGGPHAGHTAVGSTANQHWWPNQLSLTMLHQNSPMANPMGDDFDYAAGVQDPRPRRGEAGPRPR